MTPLKRILIERGIKNKWLAEKCKTDNTTIGQIANGKRVPTMKLGLKIAHVLNLSVEELWGFLINEDNSDI